ncbi:MAG: PAS domain-containing protein, partial [Lachnospiraceae bacterium]|nr:PAS domain-containing protein [Lachnospiraceae bacterium]
KHLKELYHSEDGMESNAFRTRYNDKYYWMIYNVLPFEYLDKWYAFSGCRVIEKFDLPEGIDISVAKLLVDDDVENNAVDENEKDTLEELSKGLLMSDKSISEMMNLLDIGIFWKNKERKFVGANKYFLDYYGFSSLTDIAGLNDEEVGWHINPGVFKNDEEDVLKYGISITGRVGNCLRRGDNRTIVAFKKPLHINGKIEGLIGCFFDVTDMIDILPKYKIENYKVRLDNVPVLDVHEYGETLGLYIREYERYKHDFVLLSIEIDGYSDYITKNGREKYDETNQKLVKLLVTLAGINSIVARIDGFSYSILHQFDNRDEIVSLSREIGQEVAKILPQGLAAVVNSLVFSGLSEEEKRDMKWNFASDKFLD